MFHFRIYHVLPLPDVGRRPTTAKIYFNRVITRQSHTSQRHRRILVKCVAEHTDAYSEEEKEEDISKATLIWRALKLPIYTVALIPITVSSSKSFFVSILKITQLFENSLNLWTCYQLSNELLLI